jgi:hypothetical protein
MSGPCTSLVAVVFEFEVPAKVAVLSLREALANSSENYT